MFAKHVRDYPMLLRVLFAAGAIVVMAGLLQVDVLATIIQVPADQPTIQAGVNAAANGDTVLVNHGIYRENAKIFNKNVFLTSRYLLDQDPKHILQTIIDGSTPVHPDTGSCLIVLGGSGVVVQGFTLTGGNGTLWFDPSDGNTYREGGGILTDQGSTTIRRNLIVNNHATGPGGTSSGGGGIRSGFGNVSILDNVIAYNQGWYGAGVVMFHETGEIKNNVVWKNSGGQAFGGAGLWIWNSEGCQVENNTIVENASVGAGGGISLSQTAGPVTLLNNIIRANTAGTSPQIFRSASGANSTVEFCDVQGGFVGTGNINRLPLYADSNFLLTAASPCVDSGADPELYNDIQDGGNPGFALFPSRGTLRNDMGAYGGSGAKAFPLFTSPKVSSDISSLDFGTDSVGKPVDALIPFHKLGWGLLSVDSVIFSPTNPGLSTVTVMPSHAYIGMFDTIVIRWTPGATGGLSGTARVYHNDTSVVSPIDVSLSGTAVGGCCAGLSGNVDCDPDDKTDISDLSALIDNLYVSFTPLCCAGEANVDGSPDGKADISDLSALIDYLYVSFTLPAPCL